MLKDITKISGKFYNPLGLYSHLNPDNGKFVGISLGTRSIGKSTGFANAFLLDYLQRGSRFLYCRQTQDTLDISKKDYFNTAIDLLNDNGYDIKEFMLNGNAYYLNGNVCGYAIPISLSQKYKSMVFGTAENPVRNMMVDEFISENGRYIKDEYRLMTSLFTSATRYKGCAYNNDACIILTANNVQRFYNPYFLKLHVDKYYRVGSKFINPKNEIWCLENTTTVEATKDILSSNAYMLADDTYKAQAFKNDNSVSDEFIERIIAPMDSMGNFIFDNHKYGLYFVPKKGVVYVSERAGQSNINFALTLDDHSINTMMIKTYRNYPAMQILKENYDNGRVRFETIKCRQAIDTWLGYMA